MLRSTFHIVMSKLLLVDDMKSEVVTEVATFISSTYFKHCDSSA